MAAQILAISMFYGMKNSVAELNICCELIINANYSPEIPMNGNAAISLKDILVNYNWKHRDISMNSVEDQERLMKQILAFNIKEPVFPVSSKCVEPKLPKYSSETCRNAGNAFTGNLRSNNTKMAHIINFGFESDILEIHLNELFPVVDKIFICECSYIHGTRGVKKPYVWDLIKDQPRFKKFQSKVIQIKIGDEDIDTNRLKHDIWHVESTMERLRWERFLEWNKINKFFKEDDIVGFGDTDEIASIKNLNLLKQCETKTYTDVGIWFTRARITEREETDWPVSGHRFALGDPTFFTISQAKEFQRRRGEVPCRRRGRSPNFVLGGLHITSYRYLPQFLLKLVSTSESSSSDYIFLANLVEKLKSGTSIHEMQRIIAYDMVPGQRARGKTERMNPSDIGKGEYIIPWFLECNEKRFSPFFEKVLEDPRLG